MSTGTISSRYAKALLLYATQTGGADRVYSSVKAYLENPAKASAEPLPEELEKFVALVVEEGRESLIKLIFRSFLLQYEASRKVSTVIITTAGPSAQLRSKIEAFARSKFEGELQFEYKTDPSIVGGFILETRGRRLDLSVKGKLKEIEDTLVEKHNRIV